MPTNWILPLMALLGAALFHVLPPGPRGASAEGISLPQPRLDSSTPVEKALFDRRSVRSFADESLSMEDLAQLLWAAQGITGRAGFRTAPSAGALYPLETYVVAGKVASLPPGIYRYLPEPHQLVGIVSGDRRSDLASAALGQEAVKEAPASIVFSAIYDRTTAKYRERGIRYVHMEAGHAAQNLCLQAVSLNLATVPIGAFFDEDVKRVMHLEGSEQPLYILPVGRRNPRE